MSDVKITISKVDDDTFVGGLFFNGEYRAIYATDYIQALENAKQELLNLLKEIKEN